MTGGPANTQRAVAQAKADSSGTAAFSWTQIVPPLGTILRGTVAVPNAPAGASSNVTFQGATLPPFLGSNPWGPFDVLPGEVLTVTTTGLVPGTTYTAMFVFQQIAAAAAGAGLPIPYSSNTTNVQGIAGAQAVAVEDRVDELYSAVPPSAPSTTPASVSAGVAPNDYGALELNVNAPAQVQGIAVAVTVTRPSGITRITKFQTVPGQPQSSNYSGRWIFEIGVKAGDTVGISYMTTASVLFAARFSLYGHPIPPASPMQVRADGYLVPSGSLYANSAANAPAGATVTLIGAPGANFAIMLRQLWIATGASSAALNAITSMSGTLGGAAKNLLLAFSPIAANGGGAFVEVEYDTGLLLDPNTAVTVPAQSNATATNNVGAVYDVVAA